MAWLIKHGIWAGLRRLAPRPGFVIATGDRHGKGIRA